MIIKICVISVITKHIIFSSKTIIVTILVKKHMKRHIFNNRKKLDLFLFMIIITTPFKLYFKDTPIDLSIFLFWVVGASVFYFAPSDSYAPTTPSIYLYYTLFLLKNQLLINDLCLSKMKSCSRKKFFQFSMCKKL